MAHVVPAAPDLIARYPAFADVAPATIDIYLTEAADTGVDDTWSEKNYGPAILALAAHNMALLNIGTHGEVDQYKRAGVNRIRSGGFDASFSESAVAKASGGGLEATIYGKQYKLLLRREKAGPRIVGGGSQAGGWGPTAQQNDGGVLPWAY